MKTVSLLLFGVAFVICSAHAGDWPQYGRTMYRNMVSDDTKLPVSFEVGDAETPAKNIKWKVTFNDEIRGFPIVANGRLFIPAGDTLYVIQETEGKSTL